MALKDWKKIENKNPDLGEIMTWENKKEDRILWIQNTGKSFYVNSYQGSGSNVINKRFEKESSARGYAKNYMRTH